MYEEIEKLTTNETYKSDILAIENEETNLKRFTIKRDLRLILFSSHTPCKYFEYYVTCIDFTVNNMHMHI